MVQTDPLGSERGIHPTDERTLPPSSRQAKATGGGRGVDEGRAEQRLRVGRGVRRGAPREKAAWARHHPRREHVGSSRGAALAAGVGGASLCLFPSPGKTSASSLKARLEGRSEAGLGCIGISTGNTAGPAQMDVIVGVWVCLAAARAGKAERGGAGGRRPKLALQVAPLQSKCWRWARGD